jgi:hypothetical protein
VFHSPHPGQRPIQLGAWWPQAVQAKWVPERAIYLMTMPAGEWAVLAGMGH